MTGMTLNGFVDWEIKKKLCMIIPDLGGFGSVNDSSCRYRYGGILCGWMNNGIRI